MNAEFVLAILGFVAFAIPIVGALWKIFSIRESLSNKIKDNAHRIEILELKVNEFEDKQLLALNGQREMIEHVRSRSSSEEEKLKNRLIDVECFLEKTTQFSKRHS